MQIDTRVQQQWRPSKLLIINEREFGIWPTAQYSRMLLWFETPDRPVEIELGRHSSEFNVVRDAALHLEELWSIIVLQGDL